MRLLLPPLLISVDWFLKKCICVHSTADTALLFYTKWWNFAMLFRKNPKKSSEILQSVAKLVDFFYFLSDFQGIKMRNVSRETLCWNKKLFWCEMDEKTSRRQNKKFFDPTIFQKCWRGVGEQPTFAEQTKFCNLWLPCCNCTFWNFPIRNWVLLWNKLQIQTGQRGNCSTLAGKSRGGTPFCRTLKIVFSKKNCS